MREIAVLSCAIALLFGVLVHEGLQSQRRLDRALAMSEEARR